eukprot:7149134-Pyramimonas_sp.AAC.1
MQAMGVPGSVYDLRLNQAVQPFFSCWRANSVQRARRSNKSWRAHPGAATLAIERDGLAVRARWRHA